MVRLCRCFLIWLTLIFSGISLHAASSTENRAFDAAAKVFLLNQWDYAETNFSAFIQKYPTSTRVPEAILYQAEARYNLHQYDDAIELLSTNRSKAGPLEDKYLFWMAQSHLGNTNYSAAAEMFSQLLKNFPASTNRLEAALGEAAAYAGLQDWTHVVELLGNTGGLFQQLGSGAANDQVAGGYLLLGEAHLALKDYSAASNALKAAMIPSLKPELSWRRWYFQCRLQAAQGNADQAVSDTTNLITIASIAGSPRLLAGSYALKGEMLEALGQFDDAIDAYHQNLTTNAPVDQQRAALLKIAEISLGIGKTDDAVKMLEDYWKQYPRSGAADLALLTIGEVQLKEYLTGNETESVNLPSGILTEALNHFDTLLTVFSNSPTAGKALLNKGWCLWAQGKFAESGETFRLATERLPFSEDQAIARYKWADAQLMLTNYEAAAAIYSFLVNNYATVPEVKDRLLEQALYQLVRAAMAATNMTAASEAMQKILNWYPNGFAGGRSLLLIGQGLSQQGDTSRARERFQEFEQRYPGNPLLPEVRLAIARSFEKEENWGAAITNYQAWIASFTNDAKLPRAQFWLAWDTSRAGDETNALSLFVNFVTQYPSNELASQAQWWVGDFYYNRGDFVNAVKNYQTINGSSADDLVYQARFRAGKAAFDGSSYKDALSHFTNLFNISTCPPGLRIKAAIAAGDVLMTQTGTTNRLADLREAASWFMAVPPTNQLAPAAWGRLGDCYKELAAADERNAPSHYEEAAKAYQRVLESPLSGVATRCQAEIGLGIVAEKQAERKNGAEQMELMQQALQHYLNVFVPENIVRDGEQPDWFWIREAGLKAAHVDEQLQKWDSAVKIYEKMQELFPAPTLRAVWENKLLNARKQLSQQKS